MIDCCGGNSFEIICQNDQPHDFWVQVEQIASSKTISEHSKVLHKWLTLKNFLK